MIKSYTFTCESVYVSKNWFARRSCKYSVGFFILFWAAAFLWFSSISGFFFFLNGGSYTILITIITIIMMMKDSCHFCSEFFHTIAVKCFSCHSRHHGTKQMMSHCSAEAGGALNSFQNCAFCCIFHFDPDRIHAVSVYGRLRVPEAEKIQQSFSSQTLLFFFLTK